MAQFLPETGGVAYVRYMPSATEERIENYEAIYEANRDRVYSLAFWMTDSEPKAEVLLGNTFLRAFSIHDSPSPETIDRALISELRQECVIGPVTLETAEVKNVTSIRKNTKRVELERAIVGLPHTERMIFCMHDGEGYDHARIARTLGISEDDSRRGLHQARLRIREIVAESRAA